MKSRPEDDCGGLYWIGRSSWRKWRSIAKDNFRKTIEAETRNFVKAEIAAASPGKSPPLSPFLPTLNGGGSQPSQVWSLYQVLM